MSDYLSNIITDENDLNIDESSSTIITNKIEDNMSDYLSNIITDKNGLNIYESSITIITNKIDDNMSIILVIL